MATFGGIDIFGDFTKQHGPISAPYRSQQHALPGVAGYRNYKLGKQSGPTFRVTGRLTATTLAGLEAIILTGIGYCDGTLREYVGEGGTYPNCELKSYGPIGNYNSLDNGTKWTVQVEAQLVQVVPT